MKKTSSIELIADVISLLVKKPRTAYELHDVTGTNLNSIRKYMKALESEGLVRGDMERVGFGKATVWKWQQ